MKQETLEEAGEKLYPNRESFLHRFQNIERKAFTEGAKWQQERSYSEKDLECAWNSSDQNMRFQFSSSAYKAITFKQWLEKFKQEK